MSAVSVTPLSTVRSGGVVGWVREHPLIAFFVIAFAGDWIVTLPLVLAQNGLGLFSYTIPEPGLFPLSYWFAIPASIFGPTLGSLAVTAITARKAGMRQLVWALFHLPFFFVPGQIFPTKVGASAILVQLVLLIIVATLIRIVMTWVFNNTKGSVLIAVLLHAALDASNSASDY